MTHLRQRFQLISPAYYSAVTVHPGHGIGGVRPGHQARIHNVSRCEGGGRVHGGGSGHLTTFGEADIFVGLADLEGGFLAATAALIDVNGFLEGLLALFGVKDVCVLFSQWS